MEDYIEYIIKMHETLTTWFLLFMFTSIALIIYQCLK